MSYLALCLLGQRNWGLANCLTEQSVMFLLAGDHIGSPLHINRKNTDTHNKFACRGGPVWPPANTAVSSCLSGYKRTAKPQFEGWLNTYIRVCRGSEGNTRGKLLESLLALLGASLPMANIAKFSPEPPFKNFQKVLFINDFLKVLKIPKGLFQKSLWRVAKRRRGSEWMPVASRAAA